MHLTPYHETEGLAHSKQYGTSIFLSAGAVFGWPSVNTRQQVVGHVPEPHVCHIAVLSSPRATVLHNSPTDVGCSSLDFRQG
jgi:hypothetical protein